MKKKLTILLFCLIIASESKSQVTLEHTYPLTTVARIVNLSNSGYKYLTYDGAQVKLYNTNHSLWKSINIYPQATYVTNGLFASENLFNSDNLVEICYGISTGILQNDSIYVLNENGNIIFREIGSYPNIQNMGMNVFKLIIFDDNNLESRIYNLPGTLPCNPCNGTMGITMHDVKNTNIISNAYPNPTRNITTIPYNLPEGINQGKLIFYNTMGVIIKEFTVDKTFKELQISNEDLSSGTYYYQMQTRNGVSEGKKLVIIK